MCTMCGLVNYMLKKYIMHCSNHIFPTYTFFICAQGAKKKKKKKSKSKKGKKETKEQKEKRLERDKKKADKEAKRAEEKKKKEVLGKCKKAWILAMFTSFYFILQQLYNLYYYDIIVNII